MHRLLNAFIVSLLYCSRLPEIQAVPFREFFENTAQLFSEFFPPPKHSDESISSNEKASTPQPAEKQKSKETSFRAADDEKENSTPLSSGTSNDAQSQQPKKGGSAPDDKRGEETEEICSANIEGYGGDCAADNELLETIGLKRYVLVSMVSMLSLYNIHLLFSR